MRFELEQFRWYRRLVGGAWCLVWAPRISVGSYWTRDRPERGSMTELIKTEVW